jgi:hypothetical protein
MTTPSPHLSDADVSGDDMSRALRESMKTHDVHVQDIHKKQSNVRNFLRLITSQSTILHPQPPDGNCMLHAARFVMGSTLTRRKVWDMATSLTPSLVVESDRTAVLTDGHSFDAKYLAGVLSSCHLTVAVFNMSNTGWEDGIALECVDIVGSALADDQALSPYCIVVSDMFGGHADVVEMGRAMCMADFKKTGLLVNDFTRTRTTLSPSLALALLTVSVPYIGRPHAHIQKH